MSENKIAALLKDTYDAHISIGTAVDYLKRLLGCLMENTGGLSARCENQGSATTITPDSEWMG